MNPRPAARPKTRHTLWLRAGIVALTAAALTLPTAPAAFAAADPAPPPPELNTAAATIIPGSSDGFTWEVEQDNIEKGATITGARPDQDHRWLTIPETVRTIGGVYPVTAIGDNALRSLHIEKLNLPSTLRTIGNGALANNSFLTIDLPAGLTTIGPSAFRNNSLVRITLPTSVSSIGVAAFSQNLLSTVTLPSSLTTIAGHSFEHNRLTSVSIPTSVTTIDRYAFFENDLTSLTVPSGVKTIGDLAFFGNAITELTLPDTVRNVGVSAFYANALTSLTLSPRMTSISQSAFEANALTSLTIPDGMITIGESAFSRNNLKSLDLGDGVVTIDDYAFTSNDFSTVRLPQTLRTIGDNALASDSLDTVHVVGTGATSVTVKSDDGASFGYGNVVIVPQCEHVAAFDDRWFEYDVSATSTVTYALHGHGSPITAATPACGAVSGAPTDPTDPDWVFTGWFDDADLTIAHDFSAPVNTNLTLHAGWDAKTAPTMTGADAAAFVVGQASTWHLDDMSGTPAPTVTATNLPDGLSIDKDTGTISGTATEPGTTTVTLTASNGYGEDDTLDVTITATAQRTSFELTTDKDEYVAGEAITIGGGDLPTGTEVSVFLRGAAGTGPLTLGTATVGDDGSWNLITAVPEDTDPGERTLEATATVDDRELTATATITVSALTDGTPPPGDDPAETPRDDPADLPRNNGDGGGNDRALPRAGADAAPGLLAAGVLLLVAGITVLRRRIRLG